jgi:hypothetical protein
VSESSEVRVVATPAPLWQVVIDAVLNVTLVPLSWVFSLFEGQPPVGVRRRQFQVVVINARGQRRVLQLADSIESAEAAARDCESRIASIGLGAWVEEIQYRVPVDFFRPHLTADRCPCPRPD